MRKVRGSELYSQVEATQRDYKKNRSEQRFQRRSRSWDEPKRKWQQDKEYRKEYKPKDHQAGKPKWEKKPYKSGHTSRYKDKKKVPKLEIKLIGLGLSESESEQETGGDETFADHKEQE
jgi:hypothetical protein